MEKHATLLLVSAVCFMSLIGTAFADQRLFVEGRVYCDTCRAQFVTRVSHSVPDAKVRLDCKNRTTNQLTFSEDAITDESGTYKIAVDGDHEDDICEIVLVKSSDPECSEISQGSHHKRAARISLTSNNGIITPTRLANPLGFMRKKPLPECGEVFKELGILHGISRPSGSMHFFLSFIHFLLLQYRIYSSKIEALNGLSFQGADRNMQQRTRRDSLDYPGILLAAIGRTGRLLVRVVDKNEIRSEPTHGHGYVCERWMESL